MSFRSTIYPLLTTRINATEAAPRCRARCYCHNERTIKWPFLFACRPVGPDQPNYGNRHFFPFQANGRFLIIFPPTLPFSALRPTKKPLSRPGTRQKIPPISKISRLCAGGCGTLIFCMKIYLSCFQTFL